MLKSYLINSKTSSLISYFHNGHEYSQVQDGKESFLVSQTPNEIVEASLYYFGLNLDASITSARSILKRKDQLPIVLSASKNIVLIKCDSPNQQESVWLIHSRIHDIWTDKNRQTIVQMADGHSLTIAMRPGRLQTKRHQAAFLRTTLLERQEKGKTMTFLYKKNAGIVLVKEEGHIHYTVKKATILKIRKNH